MTQIAATTVLIDLLRDIPSMVSVDRIERVWVFSPRVSDEVESGLVVLSLLAGEGPDTDQREVVTVEYEARGGKPRPAPVREMLGRGWAPAERVPQLISGVVRRLGEGEEEPLAVTVKGEIERWGELVERVSVEMVDPANGE